MAYEEAAGADSRLRQEGSAFEVVGVGGWTAS